MYKNLVLFADAEVGIEITKYLVENFIEDISHIVVASDKSKILKIALSEGLDCSIYGSQEYNSFISNNEFEYGFLIWWPKIIPKELINQAKNGFINTHPSLLPFSRGKHYNFWTILEETEFGVTLHYVNEGIDSGDIIYQKKIKYGWLDNGETLFNKAKSEMILMFKEFYPFFRENKFTRKSQDLTKGSYHNSTEIDEISKLDLNKEYLLKNVLNLLRARTFDGHPACFFKDPETDKTYEVRISINEK